jgi:recombination protein RecA
VRVKKNKVAPPFREAEFDIMYDEGISRSGDVLDYAGEMDVIEKRGSYYSYKETSLAQGRENTKAILRESPALLREIENLVREVNGLQVLPPFEGEPELELVAEEAEAQTDQE